MNYGINQWLSFLNQEELRNKQSKFIFMFVFLICFSKSEWWDFDQGSYPEIENQSLSKPVFAIFTSPSCPHCRGLPQMLKDYADGLNNTKILFTHVDCSKHSLCSKAGIRGVPSFLLIRGQLQKYWVQTYERGSSGWNQFLNDQIKPSINLVDNLETLNQQIKQSENGGTHFHLEFPNASRSILKSYKKTAAMFKFFGCSFSYSFSKTSASRITAYRSQHCNLTLNNPPNTLHEFFEANKFSSFHPYDYDEFISSLSKTPMFIAFSEDKLQDSQKIAIDKLSGKYCGKVSFGWADVKSNEKLLQYAKKSSSDVPFHFVANSNKGCLIVSMESTSTALRNIIVEKALKGENCMKIPSIKVGNPTQIRKTIMWISIIVIVAFVVYFIYEIKKPVSKIE